MDVDLQELSDDGHFLSDTDDEYHEDFEEWDKLGKESDLSKLDENEFLRFAAENAEAAKKELKDVGAEGTTSVLKHEGDQELENNRHAWLSMKNPLIGKRTGKKAKYDSKIKTKTKKPVPKTEEEITLEKLAFDEIMRETKRGRDRAEEMGTSGWQKPKVPPTNKRFLRNTLLSTVSRSQRRDDRNSDSRSRSEQRHSDEQSDENSTVNEEEGIKPEVDAQIDQYRKKRAQYYEDEKHHRKQKSDDKRSFNKVVKQAERQAEKEKRTFDHVMRYGVKVGASREKVTQENKKAIFDRYHGVWMHLDKTYRKPGSKSDDSDQSEGESHGSSNYRRHDHDRRSYPYQRGRRNYHYSAEQQKAWQAYYTATAYNYYKYMQENHSEKFNDRRDNYRGYSDRYHVDDDNFNDRYDDRPGSSKDTRYSSEEYRYRRDGDRSQNRHEREIEFSDSGDSDGKRHKKHKKHKKGKKSKRKHKKSSKKRKKVDSDGDDEHDSDGYKKSSKKIRSRESDTVDSDSDSELTDVSNDVGKSPGSWIKTDDDERNYDGNSMTVQDHESRKEKHRHKSKHKSKHKK